MDILARVAELADFGYLINLVPGDSRYPDGQWHVNRNDWPAP